MTNAYDWSGPVGDVWAREWQRTDRSFAGLSPHLNAAILAAAPDRGLAIDLGCGAGETSIALATARPALTVRGVDLSDGLIAIATDRAAGIANLAFHVGDTAALDPATAATLFVSRHGVMFFADPVAALTSIRRAASPGAALVFSCFRAPDANPWSTIVDAPSADAPVAAAGYAPGPFGFADREATAAILARAGWTDIEAVPIDYTYIAGAGPDPVADAVDFFAHIGPAARALADAEPDRRADLLARLTSVLAAHETDGQIEFPAAAWIWTARAGEPA
ncbi:MAG: methyltransferase domain-containing protein [Pseudomonadota bacterium]